MAKATWALFVGVIIWVVLGIVCDTYRFVRRAICGPKTKRVEEPLPTGQRATDRAQPIEHDGVGDTRQESRKHNHFVSGLLSFGA